MTETMSEISGAAKSASRVPAATRTLRVLEVLGSAGGPLTAQAVALKLGIPRSSTYQLLEVLKGQGYVLHFPEEGRWALGVAAFELGSAYLRHDPLERLAQPLLTRLLSEVDSIDPRGFAAVAQLGVLHGSELLYLLKGTTMTHTRAELRVVTDIGVRLPAHLTASGRSLLALQTPAQFAATYPGKPNAPLDRRTGVGPENLGLLRELLALERKIGYSTETGSVTEGYSSVAAAAVNHLAIPSAAFAVTFRTDRVSESGLPALQKHLGELLQRAARELSKRLGAK